MYDHQSIDLSRAVWLVNSPFPFLWVLFCAVTTKNIPSLSGTRTIYVDGLAELFGFHVPTIVGSNMTIANGWRGELVASIFMLIVATFDAFCEFIDICFG